MTPMKLRRNSVLVLAAFAVLAILAAQAQHVPPKHHGGEQGHAQDTADPRKLFEERCVACHVGPDLAYATDGAWIEQVRGTA